MKKTHLDVFNLQRVINESRIVDQWGHLGTHGELYCFVLCVGVAGELMWIMFDVDWGLPTPLNLVRG